MGFKNKRPTSDCRTKREFFFCVSNVNGAFELVSYIGNQLESISDKHKKTKGAISNGNEGYSATKNIVTEYLKYLESIDEQFTYLCKDPSEYDYIMNSGLSNYFFLLKKHYKEMDQIEKQNKQNKK